MTLTAPPLSIAPLWGIAPKGELNHVGRDYANRLDKR
jgi:hypothetical protein